MKLVPDIEELPRTDPTEVLGEVLCELEDGEVAVTGLIVLLVTEEGTVEVRTSEGVHASDVVAACQTASYLQMSILSGEEIEVEE